MKSRFLNLYILSFLTILTVSCTDKPLDLTKTDKHLSTTPRMNKYTQNIMTHVYLWADEVRERNPSPESDPQTYFQSYLYKDKDKWSYMDDQYTEPSAGIDGYDQKFGYELQFSYYGNGNEILAQICYVYPHTPASDAGLKRGDIILKNNGHFLNPNNYQEIYNAKELNLELADLISVDPHTVQIVPRKGTYTLIARQTEINPILKAVILEQEGEKTGYLCYTEFVNNNKNSLTDLQEVIAYFKSEGIGHLILDLRYNRGGYLTAARHLCSLLAPAVNVKNEDLLIYKQWNREYQGKSGTEEHFDKSVLNDNLDLQHLYILTGTMTASASELLISGLRPYIPGLILLGNVTAGKYVGSQAYRPDDEELRNYVLHPIVFAYSNVRKESVEGGIIPHYRIYEDVLNMGVLGDPEEPLLRAALSLITQQSLPALTSRSLSAPFRPFFPENQRGGLVDDREPQTE